jgi:hypothetical protein
MDALKEWATVVKALENGDQLVLLRKGGILEAASGFEVQSKKFLLFPTHEHQRLDYIKPKFHYYLDEIKKEHQENGQNKITSYAEVLYDADIDSRTKLDSLSPFHIWSDSYINERRNWKPEKPIKAIFLKVFKFPEFKVPIKPEYHGCKSWIDINEELPVGKAVLDETTLNSRLKRFKEIVN